MVNNTKYGSGALENNSGINNTAVGAYTSYNNLDASNNTAVGSNSAYYTTTGSNNTSLGAGSLCNNTTGALNTAIGSSALEGSLPIGSVGNQNTAVGAQALYTIQGNQNTAIGAYSALGVTGGNYNTFLGANSSTLNNTTYSYSTAIGYGAIIDASNQIMMGGTGPNGYPDVIIPGKAFLPNFSISGIIQDDEIVPRSYVDLVAGGLKVTETCLCATTQNISFPFSGVPSSSATDGIDLSTLADGSYNILVINQDSGATANTPTLNVENGVWVFRKTPGPTYTWNRPVAPAPMHIGYDAVGAFSFIQLGSIYGRTALAQININSSGVALVGTDELKYQTFYQLSFEAGRGLNTQIINQELYLNVDTSLNFVNFLDSNTSDPNANGTLALGTNTTNKIVIGPTGTSVPIQAQSIIEAQQGITGPTGSFTYLSASAGITGPTGSFSYLSASQQISAPEGITGGTGSFSYGRFFTDSGIGDQTLIISELTSGNTIKIIPNGGNGTFNPASSAGNHLIVARGNAQDTATLELTSWSNTNSVVLISPTSVTMGAGGAGATPTTSVVCDGSNVIVTGQIIAQSGITGATGSFSYLSASQQISAPEGITGGTGSFTYLSAARLDVYDLSVNHLATIGTSTTNLAANFITTTGTINAGGLITAQGGITGATGSFSYLSASQQISAPEGITGGTGSFSYLSASQQISAPEGITGGTGSFTYLNSSETLDVNGNINVSGNVSSGGPYWQGGYGGPSDFNVNGSGAYTRISNIGTASSAIPFTPFSSGITTNGANDTLIIPSGAYGVYQVRIQGNSDNFPTSGGLKVEIYTNSSDNFSPGVPPSTGNLVASNELYANGGSSPAGNYNSVQAITLINYTSSNNERYIAFYLQNDTGSTATFTTQYPWAQISIHKVA